MKRFLVIFMLCVLTACAGPHIKEQAPRPQPSSTGMSEAMRSKAPECMSCAADMRRRLGNCGSQNSSCMSSCPTGDAMRTAMCQSNCTNMYSSCAQAASQPNDCPAYCAL